MKMSFFLFIFLSMFLGLKSQDIIYTVSGTYNQKKVPLDSIIVENVTNGKMISFRDLPPGDNYLINLSQNSFWGTVDVIDITKPPMFTVIKNVPGAISFLYSGITQTTARISVININGQVMHTFTNDLFPGNSVHVRIGMQGMYFIKIESDSYAQTFKAIGLHGSGDYKVDITEATDKSVSDTYLKTAEIIGEGDFSFEMGDSLRIWAFKKELFAWPEKLRINESDDVNFIFNEVYYSDRNEMAYPDSIGKLVPFLLDEDTMYCRKINGEYIFQEDIILREEAFTNNSLKGAYRINFLNRLLGIGIAWPDARVPYTIHESLKNDDRVQNALLYWNENSPVKFIDKASNDKNWVEFIKYEKATDSEIGMRGGKQQIRISDNHPYYGAVMHEMGHAVGLIHEHSRSDRDDWVIIHEECIDNYDDPATKQNYRKIRSSKNVGEFDFKSIMLYKTSYKDPDNKTCPNITMKDGKTPIEVQRSYLSPSDIKTLEELYGVASYGKPKLSVGSNYNKDEQSWIITAKIENQGDGEITEKKIAWKKNGDPNYSNEFFGGGTNDFSYKVENMDCGEYYCYATATNIKGTSSSDIQSLYVYPYVSVNISNITESSAKISLGIEGGDISCIHSVYCYLYKSLEDAQKKENIIKSSGELKFNSNTISFIFSDLNRNETYYMRVYKIHSILASGENNVDITEFKTVSGLIADTFTDNRDEGHVYKWVQIGNQVWMAENLAYLPAVSPPTTGSNKNPHYYVYDYSGTDVQAAKSTLNYSDYGVLYNWAAALAGSSPSNSIPSGVQGICPEGWHLPSEAEWNILAQYLRENGYSYTSQTSEIAKSMAATEKWKTVGADDGTPGKDLQSNNKSGFSGLPAGRRSTYNKFQVIGEATNWWTSEGYFVLGDPSYGHSMYLNYDSRILLSSKDGSSNGFSIRCVKD